MDGRGCFHGLIDHIDRDLDGKHLSAERVSEDLVSNCNVEGPYCNRINCPALHLGVPVSQGTVAVVGDCVFITLLVLGSSTSHFL